MRKALLPLGLFAVLLAFLGVGLSLNPREVPSPLIGKPAPAFNAPVLESGGRSFSPQEMKGKVWLLNVWASWCTACRQEHPVLMELARAGKLPIVGLNYKDQEADARGQLARAGNPYVLSALDPTGRIGLDYGVYGTPETFLVDGQGQIIFKHVGPLTIELVQSKLAPKVREAGGEI